MKVYTKIIFIILSITFLIGCDYYPPDTRKKPVALNDSLLTGLFIQTDCYPNCTVWYKETRTTSLYFNGKSEVYFVQVISDSINEKKTYTDLEFYVESGQYKYRNWYIENEWSALQNYSLIGNVLTLTNFMGETYILSK